MGLIGGFSMINEMSDMEKEFKEAVASIKVERGLSNLDLFKEKVEDAFGDITPIPHISFGNKKVAGTTAIFNTGSWFLCPGRLYGFCDLCEQCNMKFREVMGSALQSRFNNELWYRLNDAKTVADFIIASIMVEEFKGCKIDLVRFNSVGDFRNQADLLKMRDISNVIYKNIGVESYVYTHNENINYKVSRPHLTVNGSGFMVDNQFTVVSPEDYADYVATHDCRECYQDCEKCGSICKYKLGEEIVGVLK